MKRIDSTIIDRLCLEARRSPRKRMNRNLHPVLEDPVQRFLNALWPETYVRPHRHAIPPRWELFLAMKGRVAVLVFDDQGIVTHREEIAAQGPQYGVELEPGWWHALVALQPSVLLEVKEGPYSALSDKDFASWAPQEGEGPWKDLVAWYKAARVGDRFVSQS